MDLCHCLRIQAHANALSDPRLGLTLGSPQAAEWTAPRTGGLRLPGWIDS